MDGVRKVARWWQRLADQDGTEPDDARSAARPLISVLINLPTLEARTL